GNAFWDWWKENKDKDLLSSSKGDGSYDEEKLLDALMMAESGGNSNAVSKAGAVGAYQLMEGTARDMGLRVDNEVDERKDPIKSREAARKYLNRQINKYGSIDLGLKAYNVGPGALDRWINSGSRTQDLNKETSAYVGRVSKYYGSDLANAASMSSIPQNSQSSDNSQTSTTHIGTVQVNSNPQSVDEIQKSIEEQLRRSGMTGSFISGNY
ncbi:lytic transglycosylase domain-containing protein, partial [Yersinia enterocolitica]